jgi:LEA14-like dessication related protein
MKKISTLILIVTFFLLVSCSMFQVEEVKDITITIKKVELKQLDERRVRLNVSITVNNPNSFAVILSRAESDITVNGTYLAKAITPQSVEVKKGSTDDVVEITINYRDVVKVIENYSPNDKITLSANSTLFFQLPSSFEKRKIYTRTMVISKELPSLNDMLKSEVNISF